MEASRVTGSDLLQRHLRESQVVKVFNNILAKYLQRLTLPHRAGDAAAV